MTWGEHYLRKCLPDRQGAASHSGPLSVRDLRASPTSTEPRSPHLNKGILTPALFPSQGGCEDRIRWCVRKHLDHGKSLQTGGLMLPSRHPQTSGRRRVILKSSLPSPLWVCTFRKGGDTRGPSDIKPQWSLLCLQGQPGGWGWRPLVNLLEAPP